MKELLMVVIDGVAACAISVLIVGLIVWGICLCFGWGFSWPRAIGVWLVMVLMRSVLRSAVARE